MMRTVAVLLQCYKHGTQSTGVHRTDVTKACIQNVWLRSVQLLLTHQYHRTVEADQYNCT
jgi:hypothetical protein